MFQERGFNSSATRGEWDEDREAVSAALLAPREAPCVDAREIPAGPPGVPWAARRSSRAIFPDGKELSPKWCPVPF